MDNIFTYAQQAGASGMSLSTILVIAGIVGLWKMLDKADEPGWAALIPFYNYYKLCGVTMGQPQYWTMFLLSFFLITFFPLIGLIFFYYVSYRLGVATAKAYGKPESWAWGYTFLAPVFYCITGFDSSDYYGPMGQNDSRTGQAREARTVNFDVVKNTSDESVDTVVDPFEAEEASEVQDVDFVLDQPEE